jgi:hypothetical protein
MYVLEERVHSAGGADLKQLSKCVLKKSSPNVVSISMSCSPSSNANCTYGVMIVFLLR